MVTVHLVHALFRDLLDICNDFLHYWWLSHLSARNFSSWTFTNQFLLALDNLQSRITVARRKRVDKAAECSAHLRHVAALTEASGYYRTPQFCPRSPPQQSLTLPMEYSKLGDCRFPELTTLNLNLQAGTTPGIDRSRARFIEEHPSIENLHWVPINKIELSPTALPNLKRLSTNHHLLLSLDSAMPRPLECLNIYKIDDAVMAALKEIDGSCLRRLSVHNIHDFETVQTIVEMFPALRWFSMSSPYFSSHPSTLALAPIKLVSLRLSYSSARC